MELFMYYTYYILLVSSDKLDRIQGLSPHGGGHPHSLSEIELASDIIQVNG
jgi:hypothetical protein